MKRHSKIRLTGIILIFALLLQSCAVYRHSSISMQAAADFHKRILMVRADGHKVHLKRVERTDNTYYGVTKTHGQKVRIPLDEKDIKSLRPINRTLTTLGNTGFILGGLVVLTIAVFVISYGNGGDWQFNEPIIDGRP